jgi:hypothetical protein
MLILFALFLGALLNILVAGICAQFSQRPICTIAVARKVAIDKIMKEANPTPPIWPEFTVTGRGVTIVGRYPAIGGPYDERAAIVVHLSAGWPMRSMSAETAYNGQWTDPSPRLQLFDKPGPLGNLIGREMPLTPAWPDFAVNTLFYAAMCGFVIVPGLVRAAVRRHRHQCAACGYPIGTSPVCTECGRPVKSIAGGRRI